MRISVRRWEALADGVCDAAVAALMESRRPEQIRDPAFIAKQFGKVERALKALSHDLGNNKWCVDDAFSLADVAVGCVLGYLELRYKNINWQQQYPNLAEYYLELMTRTSFKESTPPEP